MIESVQDLRFVFFAPWTWGRLAKLKHATLGGGWEILILFTFAFSRYFGDPVPLRVWVPTLAPFLLPDINIIRVLRFAGLGLLNEGMCRIRLDTVRPVVLTKSGWNNQRGYRKSLSTSRLHPLAWPSL